VVIWRWRTEKKLIEVQASREGRKEAEGETTLRGVAYVQTGRLAAGCGWTMHSRGGIWSTARRI